ncbi:TonB-dependent siderophore receptor [Paracoccus versutus]|uniref:TonB-dependent siderophore receptor n=1 Tax=Paracoccus versutus TaxID=34007 RepID=UPI0015F06E60|nr:TonB-dependent siderophore receptor [Paracoccus versutus]
MSISLNRTMLRFTLTGIALAGGSGGVLAQAADPDSDGTVVLETVVIQANGLPAAETGYVAPTSINRTGAEPIDTPQTITAVTAAQITEQDIGSDLDLLNAAPGVDASIREGFLTIRGFWADRAINGIPVGNFVGRNSADLSPFEQVEVLKGPAALFTGSGGFGGVVNYSFKRPLDREHLHTTLGFGDPSSKRLTVDYNAAPMLDGRLRARIVGSYENRDSNRYPEGYERSSLFGTLEYDITDRTLLRLGAWRQRNDETRDFREGLPTWSDGGLIDFDPDTTATQDWSRFHFRSDWVTADLEHRFNDRWSGKLTYMNGETFHPSTRSVPFECSGPLAVHDYTGLGIDRDDPDGRQCHTLSTWNDWNQYEIFDATLNGSVDALGRNHALVFGVTQQRNWFRRQFGIADASDEFLVDIFDPDHHVIDRPDYAIYSDFGPKGPAWNDYQAFARIDLQATDRLSFPITARWTWIRTGEGDWTAKGEFTPTVAAVYEASENLTYYAQYAQMFSANSSDYAWRPEWAEGSSHALEDGILLPNVTGTQKEIGVKARLFGGGALATASLFEIREANRARWDGDPDHVALDGSTFSTATGETRSRGLELSLTGEVRPSWNVALGYAYIDAKYTSDDSVQGAEVGTPRHSGNIWTSYKFQSGRFEGLALGVGVQFSGPFKGYATDEDDTNRVKAPGYAIVNARVAYDIGDNTTASLNVDNLFGKAYYAEVDYVGGGNYYGETRRVSFNLNSRF